MFLSSFAVGINNPAAILTFLFGFSYFGISGNAKLPQGILLVCGVLTGTCLWWGVLTALVSIVKKEASRFTFRRINQVFGMILSPLGLAVFVKTII